jgi:DNA-binding MarR family transcriptional regulator
VITTERETERETGRETAEPLSDDELFAWRAYIETVADLESALEGDLAPTGLSLGDYQVLVFLSEADDHRMRMCDLAASLQLSPSGLTRRLDGLVRHGLVDRQPSDSDRRVMLAVLTPSGAAKLADAYPVHLASVRAHVIDRLTPGDIGVLGRIFATIQAGLRGTRSS